MSLSEIKLENQILSELKKRKDKTALRIKKLLALPDLTLKKNSPIKILTDYIGSFKIFSHFDLVNPPKIVHVRDNFDLLNTPLDHPSRSESDTYYINQDYVLRTQMTVMWPYYLKNSQNIKKLEKNGEIAAMSFGIVFRKDEIDQKHFPAFHQMDFLYICKKERKIITIDDLKKIQEETLKSLFGKNIKFRFLKDSFPFTDPSIQIEIKYKNQWFEITGAGLVHRKVLENFSLNPEKYNGWAFAFGIERLAMIKMEIPDIRIFWSQDKRITSQFKNINSKYKEVSRYPAAKRDISFIVDKKINLNNYYDLVRDATGDLVEKMTMIDSYENDEKFGIDKKSYTFRIIYRSLNKTLTAQEINKVHNQIIKKTKKEFNAIIR